MDNEFDDFIRDLTAPVEWFDENVFFAKASDFLEVQLKSYLAKEALGESGQNDLKPFATVENPTLSRLIFDAREKRDPETDTHFWGALEAFRVARDLSAQVKKQKGQISPWLKFVNMIESLQEYTGSQVFPIKRIQHKRQVRLYLAYALTWEHLRYLAGNDDGYSPSAYILETYGVELDDHG